MADLRIWRCRNCEMKQIGFALSECPHCGGSLDNIGQLKRHNPTQKEIDDFFTQLEDFRGKQE